MKSTRICQLFGIEYPIIQGGMAHLSNPELVAAVSEAGGLGMLTPGISFQEDTVVPDLRKDIGKVRSLTRKPFGVNVGARAFAGVVDACLEAALEEGVSIFTVGGAGPERFTKRLKSAGAVVMHGVFCVRHARRAEQEGVDVAIAAGFEAGGHLSPLELSTFVLVPQVVDAVSIPVVAAGGIADSRGIVAALALGAEGVQMGTRFLATTECTAHPGYKQAILKAVETDTVVTGRTASNLARVIRNRLADTILQKEASGASPQEILDFIGPGRLETAARDGDVEEGSLMCGQVGGMIREVTPVRELIVGLVSGYDAILAKLR